MQNKIPYVPKEKANDAKILKYGFRADCLVKNEIIKAAKRSGRGTSNQYTKMKKRMVGLCREHLSSVATWNRRKRSSSISNGSTRIDAGTRTTSRRARNSFFDGMVSAGLIQGDGWKGVIGWRENFSTSPFNIGVNLRITALDSDDMRPEDCICFQLPKFIRTSLRTMAKIGIVLANPGRSSTKSRVHFVNTTIDATSRLNPENYKA